MDLKKLIAELKTEGRIIEAKGKRLESMRVSWVRRKARRQPLAAQRRLLAL